MRLSEASWALIILIAMGAVTFSQPLFRHVMLDLRSVQIENGSDPYTLKVSVDRSIHRPGPYRWSVSFIKKDPPYRSVYTSERSVPFNYTTTIEPESYLVGEDLSWWAGGRSEIHEAISAGFGPGRWQIETCHYAFWDLWFACTKSNIFKVIAKGDAHAID
jgi:hypothetical protein